MQSPASICARVTEFPICFSSSPPAGTPSDTNTECLSATSSFSADQHWELNVSGAIDLDASLIPAHVKLIRMCVASFRCPTVQESLPVSAFP